MDMCTDTCRHTQTVLHLIIREYPKHLSSHNQNNLFSTIKKTKFCCNYYCIFLTLKKRTLNHLFLWNKVKIFALSTETGQKYFHVSAQVMGQIPEISLVNPVSVEYLNKPDPVLLCVLLFFKEQWKELNWKSRDSKFSPFPSHWKSLSKPPFVPTIETGLPFAAMELGDKYL